MFYLLSILSFTKQHAQKIIVKKLVSKQIFFVKFISLAQQDLKKLFVLFQPIYT